MTLSPLSDDQVAAVQALIDSRAIEPVVLAQPPGSVAARRFDRLRRIRKGQDYRAQPVTQADAELAATSALQLIESAEKRGLA